MKNLKKITLIIALGLLSVNLVACGNQTNSSSTKEKVTSSKKAQSSSKKVIKKTASLTGQKFQTPQGLFVITENHVTASATAGKKVLILRYTFTNSSKSQLVPSDYWYKCLKATQTVNGKTKKLVQGSLPFSTSTTKDDSLENSSVNEVKSGKTLNAEGSWELAKNGAPVKIKFYDSHHQLVATRQYATE